MSTCNLCRVKFPSNSKLHRHLRDPFHGHHYDTCCNDCIAELISDGSIGSVEEYLTNSLVKRKLRCMVEWDSMDYPTILSYYTEHMEPCMYCRRQVKVAGLEKRGSMSVPEANPVTQHHKPSQETSYRYPPYRTSFDPFMQMIASLNSYGVEWMINNGWDPNWYNEMIHDESLTNFPLGMTEFRSHDALLNDSSRNRLNRIVQTLITRTDPEIVKQIRDILGESYLCNALLTSVMETVD